MFDVDFTPRAEPMPAADAVRVASDRHATFYRGARPARCTNIARIPVRLLSPVLGCCRSCAHVGPHGPGATMDNIQLATSQIKARRDVLIVWAHSDLDRAVNCSYYADHLNSLLKTDHSKRRPTANPGPQQTLAPSKRRPSWMGRQASWIMVIRFHLIVLAFRPPGRTMRAGTRRAGHGTLVVFATRTLLVERHVCHARARKGAHYAVCRAVKG